MEFFALLVALGMYASRGEAMLLQRDDWYHRLRGLLAAWLSGRGLQLAGVLLPVVVLELVYIGVGGMAGGLVEFALLVLVLSYALGRGSLGAALAAYLERWSRGDFQAAHQVLTDEAAMAAPDGIEDPVSLHNAARRRLYYRSFERVFAVMFWFVLGGPAGALAYRLVALDGESHSPEMSAAPEILPLRDWADWLPARLLGLSFALVGHFDACLRKWRGLIAEVGPAAVDVLESCGNAALDLQQPQADESIEALVSRGAAEIESVEVLHRRALVVWLVVVAFLEMIG